MSDPRFLQTGFDKQLAHFIEEAGEALAAAGKTQRWGPDSVNPLIPLEEAERNADWLWRELLDVEQATNRLKATMVATNMVADSTPTCAVGEQVARIVDHEGYWERLDNLEAALRLDHITDDQRRDLSRVRDEELLGTMESVLKAADILALFASAKPKRWLVEYKLTSGSESWGIFEHEHQARTEAASMTARRENVSSVTVTPLYDHVSLKVVEKSPLTREQIEVALDWFNAIQDMNPVYLGTADAGLGQRLRDMLGEA